MPFERVVEFPALGSEDVGHDLDAGAPELGDPRGSVPEVGVRRSHDDTGNAGVDQGRGAGGRATEPVARLEGGHHGCPAGVGSGLGERHRFGVRGPRPFVPALTDHVAARRADDGTDQRVRRDATPASLREAERPSHVLFVSFHRSPYRGVNDTTGAAADAASQRSRPFLPSRLSRSVPVSHRVHPPLAAVGSRTVTAGGEFHPAPETGFRRV